MTTAEKKTPAGVIAIITDDQGRVIATHADFDRSGYGGFKLWEAQRYRARRFVIWEAVRAYASPSLTGCLDEYLMEQIGRALLDEKRGKHRLTVRAIGWPDDVCEEIEH